ncbi:MAG: acyl-CoA dehydrogenase family protein [Alphaproteobacteria bacterium]
MADRSFLDWPFLTDAHRALADRLESWCAARLARFGHGEATVDADCRALVAALGEAGWLGIPVPDDGKPLDVRALCLARETLARHHGLADFALVMQGLGTAALAAFGSPAQRARILPPVREGRAIAALAMTEPQSGSDVAAVATAAVEDAGGWVLDGEKTLISNAGIADHYLVLARSDGPGTRGLSLFVAPADAPGLTVAERQQAIAPHPLGRLAFDGCRLPADALVGPRGGGFKAVMTVLDRFRPSVGAAALGFARRALDEALAWSERRPMFGTTLADMPVTQAALADMALDIDAAALLVYRAAWRADTVDGRNTREASMAKLFATEAAQRVVDAAVQMHGGSGVVLGSVVERLYREVRALRIYEGASEVQRQIVGAQTRAAFAAAPEGGTGHAHAS